MAILSCQRVSFAYDGKIAARDVSFSLDAGDYLCILGENGSGKSTLVKGLLGLLKPVSGEVRYEGVTRREMGYVPQRMAAQNDFPASVWEVVLSGCLGRRGVRPFFTREDRQRTKETLRAMGIEGIRRVSYRALSGGQQQRVLLARAMCAADKLLLLDEPAAGLDPHMTDELYEQLRIYHQERGVTVVMISHDVQNAVRLAGKILHMATETLFFGAAEAYVQTDFYGRLSGGHVGDS